MRPTLHPLAVAIAALLGPGIASAQFVAPTTLPTFPSLRGGTATVSTNGATATQTITQSTARAAIDWVTFNIGKNAQVIVNQPSAQSVLLNRVVGAPATGISPRISSARSMSYVRRAACWSRRAKKQRP